MAQSKKEYQFTTQRLKRNTVENADKLKDILSDNLGISVTRYDSIDLAINEALLSRKK